MNEFDTEENKRWRMHRIFGSIVGGLAMLFMFFIVLDLDDPDRYWTITASQHPIELPIYILLSGLGAGLIYFGVVWVFTRKC